MRTRIAVAAMKEIVTLSIEDIFIRKALWACEQACRRLQDLTEDSELDQHVVEWASKALDALKNEKVHNLWSSAIRRVEDWRDIQPIFDVDESDGGLLAELAKSLKYVVFRRTVSDVVLADI